MNIYLNDIFGMAVHFAAILAIITGFMESAVRKKHVVTGLMLILGGILLLLFFRHFIGDNIVPIG